MTATNHRFFSEKSTNGLEKRKNNPNSGSLSYLDNSMKLGISFTSFIHVYGFISFHPNLQTKNTLVLSNNLYNDWPAMSVTMRYCYYPHFIGEETKENYHNKYTKESVCKIYLISQTMLLSAVIQCQTMMTKRWL